MLPIDFKRAGEICSRICQQRPCRVVRENELWLRVEERPLDDDPDGWTPRAQSVCCRSDGIWDALDVLRATAEVANILPASIWTPPYHKTWEGLNEETIVQVFATMGIAPYYKRPGRPERYRTWPLYKILSGYPIGSRQGVLHKMAWTLVLVGLARFADVPWWAMQQWGPEARVQWLPPALQQPLTPEAEEALAIFL
jgi:hypothetical protein